MRIERTYQFRHAQYFSQAAKEAAFFDAGIVADGRCFVKVVAATKTPSQRFTKPPDHSKSKGIPGQGSKPPRRQPGQASTANYPSQPSELRLNFVTGVNPERSLFLRPAGMPEQSETKAKTHSSDAAVRLQPILGVQYMQCYFGAP
jgi:hypothetical protein